MKNQPKSTKEEKPKLTISKSEAKDKLLERYDVGKKIKEIVIHNESDLDESERQYQKWSEYNVELLKTIFNYELIAKEYSYASGSTSVVPDPIWGNPFPVLFKNFQNTIEAKLSKLESITERLELFPTDLNKEINSVSVNEAITENCVFIGHGHSKVWKDLKDFINDRLNLSWDEFNRESPAGVTTKDRLEEMLNRAKFAFLIMTAEDEQSDGKKYSRQNVVHEIGLFQGRLGFTKAIVLLEDGCEEFSNIIGLGQIRFPQNNIEAKFEEIRKVLEREKII